MADAAFFEDDGSTMTLTRRRRRFTLAEANRTLPLVKCIVADIVETHSQARKLHSQLDTKSPREKRLQIEHDLDRVVQKLQNFVDELNAIGADIKDYKTGLIDFATRYRGRKVYLSWKLGENQIAWWHEPDEGIESRQPVELLEA